jgi:hypothetical protein
MIERLERLERGATPGPWEVMFDYLDARPGIEAPTVGFSVVIYGSPDDPTDEVGVQKMEDAALIVAMRNDLPALLSQLREQRDRTSFWETLHDERVESLEAERDKALKMRDYWYAEFKRTVDPVINPHRCSSECADNPTCPVIRAYDQEDRK